MDGYYDTVEPDNGVRYSDKSVDCHYHAEQSGNSFGGPVQSAGLAIQQYQYGHHSGYRFCFSVESVDGERHADLGDKRNAIISVDGDDDAEQSDNCLCGTY